MLLTVSAVALLGAHAAAGASLEPKRLSDEAYAETYTAVAALQDGSFALLQLLFTNAGFGSNRSACRALWVPKGGTGTNASANADEWSFDPASDTLAVGACSLSASQGGIRFTAKLEGLEMTLQSRQARRPTTPPDNKISVGSKFYEADLIVPRADATLTVRAQGRQHTSTGAMHLDHSRSNTLLPKVADCWMRFRGFSGAPPVLLQVRVPPGGGTPVGWSWPLNTAKPAGAAAGGSTVGITDGGQHRFSVAGPAGTYTVTPTRQIYRYRPTEAYGMVGKLAAPWIGDPTTTTYAAQAETPSGASVTGILEVSEIKAGGCSPR